ncbi:hypothetical protein NUW54_g4992 [Trametes sanguinea]|uniref:Uncharacterized protein n=1 Tax=Trametes sanguinea TaxID=158606 RepID=A0ACC1PYW8_9APHY|nr:hypothetical protein NUW54_g4992 [Trametes sanguinea]
MAKSDDVESSQVLVHSSVPLSKLEKLANAGWSRRVWSRIKAYASRGWAIVTTLPGSRTLWRLSCIALSFYKEALRGETETYIHLRASAEGKDPLTVLRDVVDETLRSIREVRQLTSAHPKLEAICESYLMGYIEFHIRAKRYRLDELEM